jgi:formylglycine-generating enzyme required for sulfatase activity
VVLMVAAAPLTGAWAGTPRAAAVIAVADSAAGGAAAWDVAARLEEELTATGGFVMVERARVRDLLEEAGFQQTGVTATAGSAQLGQLLNVEVLVYVQTRGAGRGRQLAVRMVDVATGRVIGTASETLTDPARLGAVVRDAARRLSGAAATPAPGDMVAIAGGTLAMGSDSAGPEAQPVRLVEVASFLLDRFEVSQSALDQWLRSEGRPPGRVAQAGLPALGVSWEDAAAYCAARGSRLPSEVEWEWAARGAARRTYPWGEALPTANRARFASPGPVAIDARPAGATPEGVQQLAGNAAEWVSDWWDPAAYRQLEPPSDGDLRVVRGGSWADADADLRSFVRGCHHPLRVDRQIGFRCARDAATTP